MILYTIQEEFKIKELEETGILKSGEKIMENDYLDSYSWIENKMRELLPQPEIECNHPLWSWYKYRGKRKHDLRFSGNGNRGDELYRIKFEIDDNKVLLTDFSDWHIILNTSDTKNYSEMTIEDVDDIDEYPKNGWERLDNKLIYNWDNIILDANSERSDIQATLWYIRQEQVKEIIKFKCK